MPRSSSSSDDWRKQTLDFESIKERDRWIADHAEYWTVVRYLGPRRGYERHETKTMDQAIEMAGRMAKQAGTNYLVYAVAGTRDAMVCFIDPEGNRHNAS